jgi:hypothetical protein
MQILRDFRCNPLRVQGLLRNPRGFPAFAAENIF